MLEFNCWFCTYTINDNYINSNIDFIRNLKSMYKGLTYVLNEDYGKENGRLHFHSILVSNEEPKQWQYGFCCFKKITIKDSNKLANYINKLTYHTLKDSNKFSKVVVSRNDKITRYRRIQKMLNK